MTTKQTKKQKTKGQNKRCFFIEQQKGENGTLDGLPPRDGELTVGNNGAVADNDIVFGFPFVPPSRTFSTENKNHEQMTNDNRSKEKEMEKKGKGQGKILIRTSGCDKG